MIERNKHPSGRISNVVFGLCQVFDGFVRVLSFGFLHTRIVLSYTKRQAHKHLEKLKEQRASPV